MHAERILPQVWTALAQDGLGANLQHYSPLIDSKIAQRYNIIDDWKLKSQIVFGNPTSEPIEKTFKALGERVKVYKSVGEVNPEPKILLTEPVL